MSGARAARRISGAFGGLLVVGAVVAGLGIARTPAASSQPTSFELQHQRILSFVGTHEGDFALGRRRFIPRHGGYGGYTVFDEFSTAHLSITASDQRGGKITISAASIGPPGYGGGYGVPPSAGSDTDSLTAGKIAKAVVRYKRKRVRDFYGKSYVTDAMDWNSTVKMSKGTKVKLGAEAGLEYGTFAFESKRSAVAGGVTPRLAGGRPKALLTGFEIASSGGTLHGDVTWTDEKSGTVAFTAPPFLAGKIGTIKALPGGRWQVRGPKGYPCQISFDESGKGSVNLGLGRFTVGDGDYGGFTITYE
jgi:hypothetical protein